MKHPMVRIILAVWLAAIALIPFVSALAQDDSVDLLEAVGIVRGAYGEVLVYGVELDEWETAAGQVSCWNFVTDAGEFCISTVDGSILTGDDSLDDDAPEMEATEEADDDDAPEMEATEEADDDDAPEMEATEEADDDDDDDREESVAAPVTLSQLEAAIAAGLNIYPNGSIRETSISTDDDSGVVIISVEFDDDREVEVNSESGDVVDFGFSGDDDDDDDSGRSSDDDDNSGRGSDDDDDNSGRGSDDDDDSGDDDDDDSGDDDDDDSGDDDDDDSSDDDDDEDED